MNAKGLIWASLIGLACATAVSAEVPNSGAAASEANSSPAPSIIGFLDPQTGVIKPLMTTTASPEVAAASVLVTGELKITGTITIVSPSIGGIGESARSHAPACDVQGARKRHDDLVYVRGAPLTVHRERAAFIK